MSTRESDIALEAPASSRCLGLIGGLGVGAGIHYYRELALAHERAAQPMHLAAQELIDNNKLDGLVLAGTDLSLIFPGPDTPFPSVDCAHAHIDAIMAELQKRQA
ncbi:MAG: hypothetical protein SGI92_26230 [Bryobacteraceae bacterium]|nr:hypothetical protein [Bryobacteraceae bacterium]